MVAAEAKAEDADNVVRDIEDFRGSQQLHQCDLMWTSTKNHWHTHTTTLNKYNNVL